ncbi:MAG: TetR/AcrR family transcriptional regulator [Cytophagales bacterium]|nr:TetR/AcrR family transcriptional regulator [Cytophagales bacterium]
MKASKADILEKTVQLAGNKGWADISVREISKAIGYSTIKIYSDFGGKDKLLFEIQKQGFAMLEEKYKKAIAGLSSPKDKLIRISIAHIRFSFEQQAYYDLMFSLNAAHCQSDIGTIKIKVSLVIRDILKEITTNDNKMAFLQYYSLIHGFAIVCRELPAIKPNTLDNMVKSFMLNFIKGIA